MLECINNQCDDCKEFKCTREICSERINPDHTPNYAEEQLEYAKENRTNLMEQVKKCVNYEEGYFELLKENANLNQLIENKDIKIEKLEQELEEVQGKNKNFLSLVEKDIEGNKKEINRLNTEVACLKAFKEKADKRIQHLINAIKNTAAAL